MIVQQWLRVACPRGERRSGSITTSYNGRGKTWQITWNSGPPLYELHTFGSVKDYDLTVTVKQFTDIWRLDEHVCR